MLRTSVLALPLGYEVGESSVEGEPSGSNGEDYMKLFCEYDAVLGVLRASRRIEDQLRGELEAAHIALGVTNQEKAAVKVVLQNLLADATTACNATFPVEAADGPVAAEERLQALLSCLQAVVSEAIHQGAATALAAAHLRNGRAMHVLEVEQGFPLGSDVNEIVDLI